MMEEIVKNNMLRNIPPYHILISLNDLEIKYQNGFSLNELIEIKNTLDEDFKDDCIIDEWKKMVGDKYGDILVEVEWIDYIEGGFWNIYNDQYSRKFNQDLKELNLIHT